MMIGKGFKPGVIGGVGASNKTLGQGANDWGCLTINSTSGVGSTSSGDIAPLDTLASWGKTACGVGIDRRWFEASKSCRQSDHRRVRIRRND